MSFLQVVFTWLAILVAGVVAGSSPSGATPLSDQLFFGYDTAGYDYGSPVTVAQRAVDGVSHDETPGSAARAYLALGAGIPHGGDSRSITSSDAPRTTSALEDASSAAFKAADDPASIFIKNKHLSTAGGNHAKFSSSSISEVQGWVAQGLRSDGVQFFPNQLDGTFRAVVPAGQIVGTKGQTFIRVIITGDGRVINAFPVHTR